MVDPLEGNKIEKKSHNAAKTEKVAFWDFSTTCRKTSKIGGW